MCEELVLWEGTLCMLKSTLPTLVCFWTDPCCWKQLCVPSISPLSPPPPPTIQMRRELKTRFSYAKILIYTVNNWVIVFLGLYGSVTHLNAAPSETQFPGSASQACQGKGSSLASPLVHSVSVCRELFFWQRKLKCVASLFEWIILPSLKYERCRNHVLFGYCFSFMFYSLHSKSFKRCGREIQVVTVLRCIEREIYWFQERNLGSRCDTEEHHGTVWKATVIRSLQSSHADANSFSVHQQ